MIGAGFDKKERKNQDVAMLQPHVARRLPAGKSGHRAYLNEFLWKNRRDVEE
jgi:hypothetical protein